MIGSERAQFIVKPGALCLILDKVSRDSLLQQNILIVLEYYGTGLMYDRHITVAYFKL